MSGGSLGCPGRECHTVFPGARLPGMKLMCVFLPKASPGAVCCHTRTGECQGSKDCFSQEQLEGQGEAHAC